MSLTQTQRFAFRHLGHAAQSSGALYDHLARRLPQAHLFIRPDVYLATVFLHTAVALLWGYGLFVALALLVPLDRSLLVVLGLVPALLAGLVFLVLYLRPATRAAQRRANIDARLPFAFHYIATLAATGMPPERIFVSLAHQPVYGEVTREAQLIVRDLRGLGLDLRASFTAAMKRSPSLRMRQFLQGAVTTLSTGDDLARYFLAKGEQAASENRHQERRFLEQLGVLAESYITLVVAAPIFVLVLLSVMIVFGGGGDNVLKMGYVLILVLIPMAQVAFASTLDAITPEV